ncbi:MAG: hypothetical protein AAF652_10510 [Cyanobacteria bacterium P01_C01_bin.72]
MNNNETMEFILALDEPELTDGQRLQFTKRLLGELRDRDEVEKADRTQDPTPEAGSKGFATIIGSITALVKIKNIKAFLGF